MIVRQGGPSKPAAGVQLETQTQTQSLAVPSSQIKDPHILRQLHAWADSSLTAVQCNIAEALDLPRYPLCTRERTPLYLHLGMRPTKWVTVVGRVVGCEERDGFTRVYVDDGTGVLVVRHFHLVIPTRIEPQQVIDSDHEEAPIAPPCGIPPEYLPPAPPKPPAGRAKAGAPDAAERARTGAAAALRARVDVGTVVKVCGRLVVQPWGTTCTVGKDKWGNGGGFVEPQADPNAEAMHIIASAKLRIEYFKPFLLPTFAARRAPAQPEQGAAAIVALGPFSRPVLRTLTDAMTEENRIQRQAEVEKRREQFLNGGARSLHRPVVEVEAAPAPDAEAVEERNKAELERERKRERLMNPGSSSLRRLPRSEQPAQPQRRREIIEIDPELAPAPAPARPPAAVLKPLQPDAEKAEAMRRKRRSQLGFEEASVVAEEEEAAPRVEEPVGEAPPAKRPKMLPPPPDPEALERKRRLARAMGVQLHEEEMEKTAPLRASAVASTSRLVPEQQVALRKAPRRASPLPVPAHALSAAAAAAAANTSASSSSKRIRSKTPIVILSSPPISPTSSFSVTTSTATHRIVQPASKAAGTRLTSAPKLRPHASLPDEKINEGLFNLHVRIYLTTHYAHMTFTLAMLVEAAELRSLAKRLVRVNLARAGREVSADVVREKTRRLFGWTIGLLREEGVVERVLGKRKVVDLTGQEEQEEGRKKSKGKEKEWKGAREEGVEEVFRLKQVDL